MANIHDKLNKIISAIFGKDVRQALYDGLDLINKETEYTTAKQQHLEETFNELVINSGNSNAEIVDARVDKNGGRFEKLGDRLDTFDSHLEQKAKFIQLEKYIFLVPNKNESIELWDWSNALQTAILVNTGIIQLPEKVGLSKSVFLKNDVTLYGNGHQFGSQVYALESFLYQ